MTATSCASCVRNGKYSKYVDGFRKKNLPCTIRANIAVANKFLNHSLRIFLSETQKDSEKGRESRTRSFVILVAGRQRTWMKIRGESERYG